MAGKSNITHAPEVEYVTTAIVYPNNRVHIGWGWECIGADWLVRGLRLMGKKTFFATGMDEHALKVQRAAEAKGLTPKQYCDSMASDIRKVLEGIEISYDRFIRTSDPDHERVVTKLVKRAFENGDIYQAKYEGLYCEGCEAFYLEKDLKEGLCPEHGTKPQFITEENFFFRLSKYQDRLLALFREHPEFLEPEHRRAEIVNFIQGGLRDFSISRSTFTWGIPLPFDPKQVIYVWFDALINYLTAAGIEAWLENPDSPEAQSFKDRWPARVHVIGKDVTRFHTIYWPAMLMSLGIPLPKQVYSHGFLSLRGARLSKSSGNIVTPDDVVAYSGADPLRYYLLSENQFSQDGNFSWGALTLKTNADLANDWGNLVNRSISMTRKYFPDQKLQAPKKISHSKEVQESFEKLPGELVDCLNRLDTSAYAAACTSRSRLLNLYIDRTKPWALAKANTPESMSELREVLYTLLEGIRWIATGLLPVLPVGMPDVFRQLGLPAIQEQGALQNLKWGAHEYQPVEPKPLYPRLELPADKKDN